MRFAATLDLLPQILDVLREPIGSLKITPKQRFQLELSLEEALVNIIKYAYPLHSGEIEVDFKYLDNNGLEITIKDWGVPFDPKTIAHKNLNGVPLEDRPIGGLGIYFMNQLLDEVTYERLSGANILKLKKQFQIN